MKKKMTMMMPVTIMTTNVMNATAANLSFLSSKQRTLTELLRRDKEWSFDVFALSELTNGRPQFFAGKFVFKKHNLIEKFHLDSRKLQAFMDRIDEGYHDNPYHNNIHATDVVMSAHWLIVKGGLIK